MADAVGSRLSAFTSDLGNVKPTTCPMSLLKFPPLPEPTTLPPPSDHPTLAHPFTIPTDIYNAVLSPAVPVTIALVYASIVTYVNTVNARRKYKPWAFSQTSTFKTLVLVHNAVLAVYSAWTCLGMINALVLSFTGWNGDTGVAGALDSLCKIHGPRGLGNAAIYNETSAAWTMTNRALHLAADGLSPQSTDVGRIWNEGLAFYGWLFYLSKFYEVVDTAIILAKGKKSSFLQTYHHAGAMLCMWAGIRYMSPPIWMFVLVNSGIHAIMYTFYLCTVIRLPVPKKLKQTLTTMQITQFVVGATYAFAHLFVAYRVPVSVPYLYHLGNVASSVASAARSDAQSATSTAIAAFSTAGVGAWLKKAALRAAGREGLAENVLNEQGRTFGVDAVHIVDDFVSREEVRFKDELHWTHCLDTSGQAFAILLNCMYLAPLTWLFVRFFITAYLKRVERRRSSAASEKVQVARQSLQDASKGLTRQVSDVITEMHAVVDDGDDTTPVVDTAEIKEEVEIVKAAALQKLNEGVERARKLKEEMGGSIDPFEQLQKKRAESVQRMRQSRSRSRDPSRDPSINSTVRAASPRSAEMSPVEQPSIAEKLQDTVAETAVRASEVAGQIEEKASEIPESIQEMAAVTAALANLESDSSSEADPEAAHSPDQYTEGDSGEYAEEEPHYEEYEEHDRPLTPIQEGSVEDHSSPAITDRTRSDISPSPNEDGTGVEEASGASYAQVRQEQPEDEVSAITKDESRSESLGEVSTKDFEKNERSEQTNVPQRSTEPEVSSGIPPSYNEASETPSPKETAEEMQNDLGPSQDLPEETPESIKDAQRREHEDGAQLESKADRREMVTDAEVVANHADTTVNSEEQVPHQEVVDDTPTPHLGEEKSSNEVQSARLSEENGRSGDEPHSHDATEITRDEPVGAEPVGSATKDVQSDEIESKTVPKEAEEEDEKAEKEAEEMSFIESPNVELEHPHLPVDETKDVSAESGHAVAAQSEATEQDATAEDIVSPEPADTSQTDEPPIAQPKGDPIVGSSSERTPEPPQTKEASAGEVPRGVTQVDEVAAGPESSQAVAEAVAEEPKETGSDKEARKVEDNTTPTKEEVLAEFQQPAEEEKPVKDEQVVKDDNPRKDQESKNDKEPSSEEGMSYAEEAQKQHEGISTKETSIESDENREPDTMRETEATTDVDASEQPKTNGHTKTNGVTIPMNTTTDEKSQEKSVSQAPSMKSKSSLSLKSTKDDNEKLPSSKAASLKSRSSLSLSVQSRHEEAGEEDDNNKENQQPSGDSAVEHNADSPTDVNVKHDDPSLVRPDTSFADAVKE